MALDDGTTEAVGDASSLGLRKVSDAQTFRALSHPVRLALIEILLVEGPLTATEAGERIGESPTTCSFHLRQLARYGFVEEAGGGKGRARPWRLPNVGYQTSGVHDDPETEVAAAALKRLLRERQLDRYRTWSETKRAYPRAWQKAAFDDDYLFWLTPDELEALEDELSKLLIPRVAERLNDPGARPPGALPVELLLFAYPVAPPPSAED